MFQAWRIKLRQATAAYQEGRLDEAGQILCQEDLREFLPAKRLQAKVSAGIVKRGLDRASSGEICSAWSDLKSATVLAADPRQVASLRQALIQASLQEARTLLLAGETQATLSRLEQLQRRQLGTIESRQLEQATRRVQAAMRYADKGKFAESEHEWAAAIALVPEMKSLEKKRQECASRARQAQKLQHRLHHRLSKQDWNGVLDAAEALLAIAPQHAPAREARRRAWSVVGARWQDSHRNGHSAPLNRANGQGRAILAEAPPTGPPALEPVAIPAARFNGNDRKMLTHQGERFLMWIDAVGGYLVCLGDTVSIGQGVPDCDVDMPIQGDLSRVHALIHRDGEGYLLEPVRGCSVNGRAAAGITALGDGDLITLGPSVQLTFRRPHPLSATARIELTSRHRTQPATDGIILMAESCVLGPGSTAHVACRQWTDDVVLTHQADQLHCRSRIALEIDGEIHSEGGPITRSSVIAGEDFSLSLEEV
jgi:hypothetical protein